MKRKTIEQICKKFGMEVAKDDDPRYSEPWSIIFSSRLPAHRVEEGAEPIPSEPQSDADDSDSISDHEVE